MRKLRHTGVMLFLQYPAFARYWFGSVFSAFGDQIGWIALIWFVLKAGGSPAAIGIVTMLFELPQVFISPIAGVWLDRLPKAKIMALANLIEGFLFIVIPIIAKERHDLIFIYLLITIAGIVLPFHSIGASPLIGELVPEERWSEAYFISQTQTQFATLAGPALGGILISLIGTEPLLYMDGATFFGCALMLILVPDKRTNDQSTPRQTPVKEFKEGIHYFLKYRPIIALSLISFFFYFLYGPYEVVLPVLSKAHYGGPTALGLLWTAFAIGSVAGSLFFSGRAWKYRLSTSLVSIIILWGIVTFVLSFTNQLMVALILMCVGGIVYAPWTALVITARQAIVPVELQARVTGATKAITVGGTPLGALVTGFILYQTNPFLTLIFSGSATIFLGLLAYLWPAFRMLDTATCHKPVSAQDES